MTLTERHYDFGEEMLSDSFRGWHFNATFKLKLCNYRKGERQRAKCVSQSVLESSRSHISLQKGILPLKTGKLQILSQSHSPETGT